MQDLLALLGVACMAPAEDVGKAHRRPACQHHPDVYSGTAEAEEHSERVVTANAVLGDEDGPKECSVLGEDSLQSGLDLEPASACHGWKTSPVAPDGNPVENGTLEFDPGDASALGFGRAAPFDAASGNHLFALTWLDLAQAIQGAVVSVEVPVAKRCNDCHGTGRDPRVTPEICPDCQGAGQQQVRHGSMRFVATCPHCYGEAEISTPCPTCRGRGHRLALQSMTLRIPPGTDDGSTLRISGKGAPGMGDDPPGDLLIETRVRPHPLFRRDGLDLHLRLLVTLDEAYNGAHLEIPTFDGKVRVLVPAGSQSGSRLRLRGKGIARGRERGDLYVEVDVRLPERRDEVLAQALRAASSAYLHPLRNKLGL
jgi:molecular chaperone DnaJ